MRTIATLPALLLLLLPTTMLSASPAPQPSPPTAASCPIDYTFVSTLPWNSSCCLPSEGTAANTTCCCQAVLSFLGISLAIRLNQTSIFGVPDLPTSAACLDSAQSNLTAYFSIPNTTVGSCYPRDFLVVTDRRCAGIVTLQDWNRKIGATDVNCKSVDTGQPTCSNCINSITCINCLNSIVGVNSQLVKIDGNSSHAINCFYFATVYAAGVASTLGPTDLNNVRCIFGLPVRNQSEAAAGGGGSTSGHSTDLLLVVGLSAAMAAALFFLALGLFLRVRAGRRRKAGGSSWRPKSGATWYSLDELRAATGDFAESSVLGQGGFAVVYRGELSDGSTVAVKRILRSGDEDRDEEFANEVDIISNLRHRNLVSLRGCSVAGDGDGDGKQWYLVYDYMPNGSLHDHLFQSGTPLTWAQRRTIVLDIARGLAYLHHGVKPAIIHRDIKPTNILLDAEMRAAVADFGLAKQREYGTYTYLLTSRVAGTHGYLAPEYALYGHLSAKVDVYSFGVMVLEIVSGRRAVDPSAQAGEEPVVVAEWARELMMAGKSAEVVEEAMAAAEDERAAAEMERFVRVGCLCSHLRVGARPTMAEALKMLEGDMDVPAVASGTWPAGLDSISLIM